MIEEEVVKVFKVATSPVVDQLHAIGQQFSLFGSDNWRAAL